MRRAVKHTAEFDRIDGLPRRPLLQEDADAWAAALTPEFRCEGSTAEVRPWQGYSIAEATENHGAWLVLPVGAGKTWVTWALPRAFQAKRPLLVIPASLKAKTRKDFASYVGVWKAPNPPPRIMTFHELAPESGLTLLERMQPDLIVIDESDDLSNPQSSAARRLDRYRLTKTKEECPFVLMTATPSRNSIMGYWHLLWWALPDHAPMPETHSEAQSWADAIDNKSRGMRPSPGPLGETITKARAWFRERLASTPGIVIVDGDSCDQPLTIRIRLARECKKLDAHYKMFGLQERENPAVPDGLIVSDPLSRWRTDGALGSGYFERYVAPGPPEEWRVARREKDGFVREMIEQSTNTSRPLDTEAQVLRRYRHHPIVQQWGKLKDAYKPQTEAVWVSEATVLSAIDWLEESEEPGVIWCGGVEFAEALTERTGLSYYSRLGKDQHGRGLHVADPKKSLIASWHANKKGFCLHEWCRMLFVRPPQSGKWLEQVLGRLHRSMQTRPVTADMLATSGGTLDAFESALSEAGFARETVSTTQKVLNARIVRATPRITPSNRFRWARREKR